MLRIAGAVVVILLVVTITVEAWALTGFIDWSALIVGLFLGFLILLFSDRRIRARLWLRFARRGPLYAPHSFAVGRTGLQITSSKFNSEIRWSTLRDVKRTEDRLFFFLTKRLAYIVPRRAFDSDADFEAFTSAATDCWEHRPQPHDLVS